MQEPPSLLPVYGVIVMCLIAIGDSYTAVLTRSMRESHFSILMFWFAAIGFLI
jgi:hypothetical protein